MAFKLGDRIRESTTSTGAGNLTLGGADVGFSTFASRLSTGDTTWYALVFGASWEVGLGTFTAPATLARTTVIASTNSDAALNLGAGTKEVFITAPAQALAPLAEVTAAGRAMQSAADVAAQRTLLAMPEIHLAKSAGAVTVSSVTLTIPAGYRAFRLLVNYLRPASNARIYLLTSQDGGTTYPNASNNYNYRQVYAGTTGTAKYDSGTGASSVIELTPLQITSGAGTTSVFDILIEPGTAAIWPSLAWSGGFYYGGSDDLIPLTAIGARRATGRLTNLRLQVEGGGNFTIDYDLKGVL